VGAGTGQMTQIPAQMFLGSDFRGVVSGGAVFDELVIRGVAASEGEMRAMASAAAPYQGQALAAGGFALGTGVAVTHGTPGTQTSVAHGLGVAPSFVQLTPHANGVVYLSAPADATSFQVKGSAASLEFSWRAFA